MPTKAEEVTRLKELLRKQKVQIARKRKHEKGSPRRKKAAQKALRIRGKIAGARKAIAKINSRRSGPDKTVGALMAHAGVGEKPDGSNWGVPVMTYIKFCGITFSIPWCGAGACYFAVKFGGAKVPNKSRLTYTGYVENDARAGANGLTEVPIKQGKKGCLVTLALEGGRTSTHIATLREDFDPRNPNTIKTVDCNTSPLTSGSQSDGGTIAPKTRYTADVVCCARLDYPKE